MRFAMILAMFLYVGCSDESVDGAGPGIDAGEDAAADAGEDAGVTINGLVTLTSGTSVPVEGVTVCLYGRDDVPCVETDADGAYALAGVPPMSEQVLTFSSDGLVRIPPDYVVPEGDYSLVPLARNYVVSEGDYSESILDATILWTTAEALQVPSPGKGGIQAVAVGSSAGHVLTIAPDPGVEPVYWEPGDVPNPDLTETAHGLTTLMDVAPGEYHASFGDDCMGYPSPGWGLPASDGTMAVRFRVVVGYVTTFVVQICSGLPER